MKDTKQQFEHIIAVTCSPRNFMITVRRGAFFVRLP